MLREGPADLKFESGNGVCPPLRGNRPASAGLMTPAENTIVKR